MPKGKTQREKFEEAARQSGASEDIDAFEAIASKIAKMPRLTAEQIRELAKRHRSESD